MNIKKILLTAVLPLLCIATVNAQQSDNTPKKGDVTLGVSVGHNSYSEIKALDGNQSLYEAESSSKSKLMFGFEAGWFVHDFWKLSLGGGVNFSNNPGYSEVIGTVDEDNTLGSIPSYRAVADQYSFSYNVTAGIDRYFKLNGVKNLMLYTGFRAGFNYGLNEKKYDEYTSMGKSNGETWNARAGLTFGADYYLFPNMYVGISVDPVTYTYNVTSYNPQEGLQTLKADSHNIKALASPTVRIGFMF